MRRGTLAVLGLLVALPLSSGAAQDVEKPVPVVRDLEPEVVVPNLPVDRIGFEAVDDRATRDGQEIVNEYAGSHGIRFPEGLLVVACGAGHRCVEAGGGTKAARPPSRTEFAAGPFVAELDRPARAVAVEIAPLSSADRRYRAVAVGHDRAGRQVAREEITFRSGAGGWRTLRVADDRGRIRRVELRFGYPGWGSNDVHNHVLVDEVAADFADGGEAVPVGPEDTVPPELRIDSPAPGQNVLEDDVELAFVARDREGSGLRAVETRVYRPDGTPVEVSTSGRVTCTLGACPDGSDAFRVDGSVFHSRRGGRARGEYHMVVRACDQLDNCVEHRRLYTVRSPGPPPPDRPTGPEIDRASRYRNAAVPGVRRAFGALGEATKLSLWYRTPGTTLTKPPFPGNLRIKRDVNLDRCHIQGVQRLPAPGFLAYSANSADRKGGGLNDCSSLKAIKGGGAHLFVAELASRRDRGTGPWGTNRTNGGFSVPHTDRNVTNVAITLDPPGGADPVAFGEEYYHPGGIQVAGDHLFLGVDGHASRAWLLVYDVSDPARPRRVAEQKLLGRKAQTIGAAALDDGRLLLAVGAIGGSGGAIDFYVERSDRRVSTRCRETGRERVCEEVPGVGGEPIRHTFEKVGEVTLDDEGPFGFAAYQSTNLVREAGTGAIYMVGVANTGAIRCGGKVGGGDPTIVDLFRVVLPPDEAWEYRVSSRTGRRIYPEFELRKIERRTFGTHNGSGCAGAGVYVSPDGEMTLYTMEHDGQRERKGGRARGFYTRGVIRFYEFAP